MAQKVRRVKTIRISSLTVYILHRKLFSTVYIAPPFFGNHLHSAFNDRANFTHYSTSSNVGPDSEESTSFMQDPTIRHNVYVSGEHKLTFETLYLRYAVPDFVLMFNGPLPYISRQNSFSCFF